MYMCGWDVHMCADSCTCSDGITLASPTLCSEVSLRLVRALLKSKQTHDKAMVNEGWTGCGGFRSLRRELYTSDQSSLRESETDSHNETIGVEKGRKNQASGWVPLKRGPQYSSCKADTGAGEKAGPRCRLDSWSSFVELKIPPRQRDWGQRWAMSPWPSLFRWNWLGILSMPGYVVSFLCSCSH